MALPKSEERADTRFDHISPLQVKDLSSGKTYEARMQNYSNGGIYFESDALFQRGAKIYICMQNFSCKQTSGLLEYYSGKVVWQKKLKRSFFDYGYGVQLITDSSNEDFVFNHTKEMKESRRHPRKSFFRAIRIGTHNGIIKGKTKNISATGVFISAEAKLELGQELNLILPFKGKEVKIVGQIRWLNKEGFGLEFKMIK